MNRGWVLATISNYNFCLSGTKDCQKFCCFSAFILVQLYQQMPQKENCYLDLDFILGFSSLGEFSPSSPGCPGSLKLQFLCSQPHEFAYSSSAFSSSWWPPWTFLVSWPVPKKESTNAHWKEAKCRKHGSTQWISLLSRTSLLKSGAPAAIWHLQTDVPVRIFYLHFQLFSVRARICYKLLHHSQKWK